MLHSAILEPAVYKATYAVTGPRNTKAGKEQAAKAEAAGFQVITQTLHDKAAELAHRVKSHPLAAELFEEGRAEVPLFDKTRPQPCRSKGSWTGCAIPTKPSLTSRRLAVVDQAQPTLPNRWPTSNTTCRRPLPGAGQGQTVRVRSRRT